MESQARVRRAAEFLDLALGSDAPWGLFSRQAAERAVECVVLITQGKPLPTGLQVLERPEDAPEVGAELVTRR